MGGLIGLIGELPAEIGEASVIVVQSGPFASGFDGEGGEPCVGGKVPAGVGAATEAGENGPVLWTRLNNKGVGLGEEEFAKG